MRGIVRHAAWLFLALAGCQSTPEQVDGIQWHATCGSDSAAVGDLIALTVEGSWPDSLGPFHLAYPASNDSLLIVASDSTALVAAQGRTRRSYAIGLIPPRAGQCVIPPAALVTAEGDTLALTEGFALPVASRLDPEQEPSMRPLAPMAGVRGFPWWILIVAGLLVLGGLLAWWFAHRRTREAAGPPAPPPIPPAIEFREGLEMLLGKKLAERGEMRAFTQELSWVFRRYLGRRCARPALEATRPEILRWLPESEFDVSDQQAVSSWLEETDGIKFAGRIPLVAETETLVKRAREMVRRGEVIAEEQERRRREAELLSSAEEDEV